MMQLFSGDSIVVSITLLVLLLCSVVTWSIVLYKLLQRSRNGKLNKAFAQQFWDSPDWKSAEKMSEQHEGQLASLARTAFTALRELTSGKTDLKHAGEPQDLMENALRQEIRNLQRKGESGLAELAGIGSTSPFIGLFGTVWGIMHALQEIGKTGSASLDVVAGPIGEALIATAFGIAAALPAVLAYNYFLRRLKLNLTDFENFADDFARLARKYDYKV
ncbi:MAG: MotA/TolQ/ExbB proton channel family protein [Gallionella sp.]|nr:MotA/TolQ/ExbB proton channel family protein [Gallionella sp.]